MTDPIRVGRFDWERAVLAEPSITGLHLCSMLALGAYMDIDGAGARPGVAQLSASTGVGLATVRRHLMSSMSWGFLIRGERGHRRGDGSITGTEYLAAVPIDGHVHPAPAYRSRAELIALLALRDGPACRGCGLIPDDVLTLQVDHVMPRYRSGGDQAENLQLLCGPCNQRKGTKHPDSWRPTRSGGAR